MPRGDFFEDLKAFGGLPLFCAAVLIAFGLNQVQLSIRLAFALILCFAITSIVRIIHFRERPKKENYKNWWQKVDASSFPSLHAMRASALASLLIFSFPNPIILFTGIACTLITAIMRVNQKKHHISDVIVGLILGIIIAYFSMMI